MVCGSTASIVDGILSRCRQVRAILLYGSAARGEATGKSDVDVLVLAEKPCVAELKPPCSVLVLTVDEWLQAPEEFRAEVLRDAIVLYASGIRLRELIAGRPWLLIRYTAPNPSARACASRTVASFEKRGLVERIAPGVALTPLPAGSKLLESLGKCGARVVLSKTVVYRPVTLYCAYCPYCGMEIVESSYSEARRKLRDHLLTAHHDMLMEQAEKLQREGKSLPGDSIKGLAGYLASQAIREC